MRYRISNTCKRHSLGPWNSSTAVGAFAVTLAWLYLAQRELRSVAHTAFMGFSAAQDGVLSNDWRQWLSRSRTGKRQSLAWGDDNKEASESQIAIPAQEQSQPKEAGPLLGLVAGTAAARLSEDGDRWLVPVEAWIYRKNDERHKNRMALCRKLLIEMMHGIKDIDEEGRRQYERMGRFVFRTFTFRGAVLDEQLEVRFDGEEEWRALPPTDKRGRTEAEFEVKADTDLGEGATASLGFTVRMPRTGQEVQSTALLRDPEGILVISDIDDTVKVTEVFKGESMVVRNTFVNPFKAVPGMPELFQKWEEELGASFSFVSNSPFEFQEPLYDFLMKSGFPIATMELRPLKTPKDQRATFKADSIEKILKQFPQRRVLLVGDSGERDPYIYAELLRNHPQQIAKIFIRQVHPSKPVDPEAFEGVPLHLWQVFNDPEECSFPAEVLEDGRSTEEVAREDEGAAADAL